MSETTIELLNLILAQKDINKAIIQANEIISNYKKENVTDDHKRD